LDQELFEVLGRFKRDKRQRVGAHDKMDLAQLGLEL